MKPYGHKTHRNPGRASRGEGNHRDCGVCGEGRRRLRSKRRALAKREIREAAAGHEEHQGQGEDER